MLNFDPAWRFEAPAGEPVPADAIEGLLDLILKINSEGDPQAVFERFKTHFARAAGTTSTWSSSLGWAETDLRGTMEVAASNPPLFIEAFHDACEVLRGRDIVVPGTGLVNRVLDKHGVPFRIEPPNLVRAGERAVILVADAPPTLAQNAIGLLQRSLTRSDELLASGQGREAVQELLFLLDSVTTAFRGIDTQAGEIGGSYFNEIVRDLRNRGGRRSLEQILSWLSTMHGYLSAPAGGGVRHGLDLNRGVEISLNEARLFCNLTRSYIDFLVWEHERLTREQPQERA